MKKAERMKFCIICKEIVNPRHEIVVRDSATNIEIKDHVCTDCFNKLLSSHHNQGFFKLSKMFAWLKKGNKDIRRL